MDCVQVAAPVGEEAVVVHIDMSADVLARSRFAISPAQEVVYAVQWRGNHPMQHVRDWYVDGARSLARRELDLLTALIPERGYIPDFLMPAPSGDTGDITGDVERIRATAPDVVEHHLDIAFRGRPVRPEVLGLFDSTAALELWRRPMPELVARLLRQGPEVLAAEAADAVLSFFDAVIRPVWPKVRAVLQRDVERRSDRMAYRGAVAVLNDLGDGVAWTGHGVELDRPYDLRIDWADDGLVLVPSVALVGRVDFAAEQNLTPMIIYPADGTARLWEQQPRPHAARTVAALLGPTRATLLSTLRQGRSTSELSERLYWSEPTVSYHLKILLRAGLVESTRRGRRVLYRRTSLGTSLLAGTDPGADAARPADVTRGPGLP